MTNKFKKGDTIKVLYGNHKGKILNILRCSYKENKVSISQKQFSSKKKHPTYIHISNIVHFNSKRSSNSEIVFKDSVMGFKTRFYKNSGEIINNIHD